MSSSNERAQMEAFYRARGAQTGWGRDRKGDYHAQFARDAWAAWQEARRTDETKEAPFTGCIFSGPPPHGFVSWNDWAGTPPYRGVEIHAQKAAACQCPLENSGWPRHEPGCPALKTNERYPTAAAQFEEGVAQELSVGKDMKA